MFQLEVSFASQNIQSAHTIDQQNFADLLKKIEAQNIQTLPEREVMVSLIFTSDEKMRQLNNEYRHKNTPTDVLSFPLFDKNSPEKISLFGEIYISLETATKQAEENGHDLQTELNILFVHGALHLLGFDHETDTDFAQMSSLEKKLLKYYKT